MYKVETIVVNDGLVKEAYAKVASKLEDALNAGAKKGWKLHSWQESSTLVKDKGYNIVIVWEVDKK
ncbi:MAG: hypothetical protein MJ134_06610 [Lachnospiraceae bacterium]|nr:hypothetical protein [Lachnospiraceae bacterium]